ncbi:RAMP superfamily CRISPR-associated protein [Phormidesmis sp. 146-35]
MTEEDTSFKLIPFATTEPKLEERYGHDRFGYDRFHGWFDLALTAQTPVHISSGIAALGRDIGESDVPMIRPMVQSQNGTLVIQGSSLKGCIRAIYEVITNSRSATQSAMTLPDGYKPSSGERLCAAGRVFGAMGYQGLVSFTDALCNVSAEVGYVRPMFSPKSLTRYCDRNGLAKGRKFYYQTCRVAEGQGRTVAIQRAPKGAIFTTRLKFKNLDSAELGALLIALGQDSKHPIALKLGAGKNQGMGTVTVEIMKAEIVNQQNVVDRYSDYDYKASAWSDAVKQKLIAEAHRQLINQSLVGELLQVLRYPTDREPREEE